jgi:hypothetical protein
LLVVLGLIGVLPRGGAGAGGLDAGFGGAGLGARGGAGGAELAGAFGGGQAEHPERGAVRARAVLEGAEDVAVGAGDPASAAETRPRHRIAVLSQVTAGPAGTRHAYLGSAR